MNAPTALLKRFRRKRDHLYALLIARSCERFPPLMRRLRALELANKEQVISHIRPARIRSAPLPSCAGVCYDLDVRDHVEKLIYFNAYEQELLSQLLSSIPSEATFLDVGAHVGFYSLNIAKRLRGGTVYAFEADPANYRRLRRNCSLNTFGIESDHSKSLKAVRTVW